MASINKLTKPNSILHNRAVLRDGSVAFFDGDLLTKIYYKPKLDKVNLQWYNKTKRIKIKKGECKMKYCSNCSAELNPETLECPACGSNFKVEEKNDEKTNETPEVKHEEKAEEKPEAKVEEKPEAKVEDNKPKNISIPLVLGIIGLVLSAFTIIGALIFATMSIVGLIPMIVAAIGTIAAFTVSIIGIVKGNKEAKETEYRKGVILSIVSLIVNIVFVLIGLVIIIIAPLISIILAIAGVTVGFPLSLAIIEELLSELFYLF